MMRNKFDVDTVSKISSLEREIVDLEIKLAGVNARVDAKEVRHSTLSRLNDCLAMDVGIVDNILREYGNSKIVIAAISSAKAEAIKRIHAESDISKRMHEKVVGLSDEINRLRRQVEEIRIKNAQLKAAEDNQIAEMKKELGLILGFVRFSRSIPPLEERISCALLRSGEKEMLRRYKATP